MADWVTREESISQYGTEAEVTRKGGNRKGQKTMGLCVICGKEMQVTDKWGGRRKTCGRGKTGNECTRILRSKISIKNKSQPPSQKGKKWGVDYPIENHNWWNGGITPVRSQIWKSKEFQNWRKSIFERDDYTCQICGRRGGKLHVDHFPVPFSEILEMRNIKSLEEAIMCDDLWNTDNGRTLCVNCHRLTPTYGINQRFRKEKYVNC